jgi:curved DNA-binding protein CbpA
MIGHYITLGVPQTATKEQIKRAYRRLSLKHHPDVPGGNKERFMQIKDAYEALMVFKPETVHQQYQHRREPYLHFDNSHVDRITGEGIISISFRNLLYIETIGALNGDYHWDTYMYTNGTIKIKKKDLPRCNYQVQLRFVYLTGKTDQWQLTFKDTRTPFEKWRYRVMYRIGEFLTKAFW